MNRIFWSVGMIALACPALAVQAAPPPPSNAAIESAKQQIWALEQSIYAGRAKGDMTAYASNTAQGYLSWPPTSPNPMHSDRLQVLPPEKRQSQEELAMTFRDFALHGDTAVIYYSTHMTRRSDGTPVDLHYEVTHTWVQERKAWRVFAGMARLAPAR